MKSGAARASTDLDKDVEILITQHSAKTARPWLSPSHQCTHKRWRMEIASPMPDDTPRGLAREGQACDKLPEYKRPHTRETLPPSQVDDFRTSHMPHQRLVVLLARLLVQRP